jgi:hypothetical protein
VAGCCECGDEPLGSCSTQLVSSIVYLWQYEEEIREFHVHSLVEKDGLKD